MIHVGRLIFEFLQENDISVVEFAEIINRSRAAAYRILANESVHTDILYYISKQFKHNFFEDIGMLIETENHHQKN